MCGHEGAEDRVVFCVYRGKEGELGVPWAGPAAKSNVLSNYGLILLT